MFCGNCGAQITGGERFCPRCGSPVEIQPGRDGSGNSYAKPRKNPLRAVAVCVCAVVLAALAALLIRFAIFGSNPLAKTIEAATGLADMNGGNINVSVDMGGTAVSAGLTFELGKNLDATVADAVISFSYFGDKEARAAVSGGDFAGEAMDERIYVKNFGDKIEKAVNGYFEKLGIDVELDVDELIKDGSFNKEYIDETAARARLENSDYDEDVAAGTQKLVKGFIFRECGKKSVWKSFIEDYKKSGDSREYTLDAAGLALAFIEYADECEDSRDGQIRDAAEMLLSSFDSVRDAKRELKERRGEAAVEVKYSTERGRMSELTLRLDVDGAATELNVEIENYNKPDIDKAEIKSFMAECRDGASNFLVF